MDRFSRSLKLWLFLTSTIVALIASVLIFKPAVVSAKNAEAIPPCATQPAGLSAWWRFEGNTYEYVQNTPMLISEGTNFTSGPVGQAIDFSQASTGGVFASSTFLDPGTGDFSLAAWVKTSAAGVQTIIDDRESDGVSGYAFYLYDGRPGLQLATETSYNNFNAVSGIQYNDNNWHYVIVTVDRNSTTGIKMYVDTTLVATYNPTAYQNSLTNSAITHVGGHLHGDPFPGALDEVDFYKYALTASDVASLYNAGPAGKCLDNVFVTPTKTAVPATATPTKTAVPATATPTKTPVPATATPTKTPVPATATPIGATATPTLPPVSGSYRDIGNIRIWADSFVDGTTNTATGNVLVGNRLTNQAYFKISGSASWTSAGVITLTGRLETYGNGTDLGLGTFTIDRTAGSVTWAPSTQVLYVKLGSSNIAITPTLTVNVLNPSVTVAGQVNLTLPENQSINTAISFTLGQNGQISTNNTIALNLKLAGGTLTGQLAITDSGFKATQVQYTLPTIGSITLYELTIDGNGPAKLHFGSNATFPMGNLDLGNGVFVLTNLRATVGLTYTNTTAAGQLDYLLDISGTLSLSGLPKNGTVSVPGFNLGISSGKVYGKVRDLTIKVAGKDLDIGEAEFETQVFANNRGNKPQPFTYVLTADWANYDLSGSWLGSNSASVALRDVVLSTAAPYIHIGGVGGNFTAGQPFYLGGNANSNVSIKFDQLVGMFRYDISNSKWTTEMTTTVTFKFGNDSTVINNAHLTIDNGSVTGSIADVTLKIAGLQLTFAELKFDNTAWTATTATLKLPASWGVNASVTLTNVRIDQNGIKINGVDGSFSANQAFYLGGNANSNVSVKFDQLSGSFNYNATTRAWTATVTTSITFKFGNDSTVVNGVVLNFSNGNVSATIQNVTLKVAGLNLTIGQLAYQNDTFTAASAVLTLPASWGVNASVNLNTIRITKDGITIGSGGASFSTSQAFYLGGNANSNASVKFDQLSGTFAFNSTNRTWSIQLSSRITFTFGTDSVVVNGATLKIENGNVSGSISSITLKVAGLDLYVDQLNYANNVFTASTVRLKLPQAWGGVTASLTGLEISKDGVRIGGASGSFAIPDQNIAEVLRLTGMTGSVTVDAQKNYAIQLSGTITIQKVSSAGNANGASVTGSLKIENGRVSGTINNFSFKLVGVEFAVTNAQFLDNKITAQQVTLRLPQALGNAQTTLYGLEIGGSAGFSISGGSFRLPDFTMAGVGVQNVQAEIIRETNGNYSIAAGAKLNFVQFSIEGRFKVAYNTTTSQISLREVYIAFEGQIPTTAIPIGTTGFYLTKVWGSFNMDTNSMNMAFGVKAGMAFQVAGKPLVGLEGSVGVQIRPSFEFTSHANATLLGYQVASADLRITRTSFSLEAELHAGIIHAALEIAFGKDSANEFTFYGRAEIALIVPRATFIDTRWVKVPKNDWNLGRMMFDAGKFRHNNQKVWGARYSGRLLGFSFYAFAKFSPSLGFDVGTNMNAYQPIRPVYRPAWDFLKATDAVYEFNVAHPTTELVLVEEITTTNILDPQDIVIMSPNGVAFTSEMVYVEDDGSQRIFAITVENAADAVGTWSVVTQDGNEVVMVGMVPAPQVDLFSACTNAGAVCLDTLAEGGTAVPVNVEVGQTIDLAWETSHVTPGLAVDVYAEGSDGSAHVLANDYTATGTSLSGSTSWTPLLPAGTYTISMRLEDEFNASTIVTKMPINLVDTTAPNALVNLQATPRADGSVLITWDTAAVAADVLGYEFSIDAQPAIAVEDDLQSYDVFGLEPGVSHSISVVLYDHTGNRSPAAVTNVTMEELTVASSWPTRDMSSTLIDNVMITFNKEVVVESFTLTTLEGAPVAGSFMPITYEQSIDTFVVIGAEFTPEVGMLPLGDYTATVVVYDAETNAQKTVEWPFTVTAPAIRVYLPTLRR